MVLLFISENVDYNRVQEMLNLDQNSLFQCVNITINDDNLNEGTETFSVSLSTPIFPIEEDTAIISILDNPGGMCGLKSCYKNYSSTQWADFISTLRHNNKFTRS